MRGMFPAWYISRWEHILELSLLARQPGHNYAIFFGSWTELRCAGRHSSCLHFAFHAAKGSIGIQDARLQEDHGIASCPAARVTVSTVAAKGTDGIYGIGTVGQGPTAHRSRRGGRVGTWRGRCCGRCHGWVAPWGIAWGSAVGRRPSGWRVRGRSRHRSGGRGDPRHRRRAGVRRSGTRARPLALPHHLGKDGGSQTLYLYVRKVAIYRGGSRGLRSSGHRIPRGRGIPRWGHSRLRGRISLGRRGISGRWRGIRRRIRAAKRG